VKGEIWSSIMRKSMSRKDISDDLLIIVILFISEKLINFF
jgi:hypothetical protein